MDAMTLRSWMPYLSLVAVGFSVFTTFLLFAWLSRERIVGKARIEAAARRAEQTLRNQERQIEIAESSRDLLVDIAARIRRPG